ncbi:MAG TPA: hypothetical protein VGJ92_08810 [Methanocella sp.]
MSGRFVGKVVFAGLLAVVVVVVCLGQATASSPRFISVACTGGYVDTVALADNGDVWAWGKDYGASPVQLQIDNVKAISAGSSQMLALRADGTVWTWGSRASGLFGDGTIGAPGLDATPQQVPGLDQVIAISAGTRHCIVLKSDGTVWSWGQNDFGDLGDGTYENRFTPGQVTGLPSIKAIGGHGLFAIARDGSLWTWGPGLLDTPNNNVTGTDGETIRALSRPSPLMVPGIDNITAIDNDVSTSHVVFVKSDGTVWSWGIDQNGVFGDDTNLENKWPYVTVPVQAKGIDHVVQVATTMATTLALKSDGTVWAWGLNSAGVQGTGTIGAIETTPVKVSGLNNVVSLAVGVHNAAAVEADGSVWGWGNGYVGPNSQGKNGFSPILAIGSVGVNNVDNTTANGTSTVTTPTESAAVSGGQGDSGNDGNLLLAGVLAFVIAVCVALIVLVARKKQRD